MAIELYPHNQETYEKMTEMFKTSNRVGVVQPTGTGKSFLYLKWVEDHPGDRFAILSPSTEIFTQLREYAENSGAPDLLDSVQMISYQALLKMSDEEVEAIQPDKMVLDEFHRTGAELWGPSLQRLLDSNPYAQVLGASATPVRYLDDSKDMASELFDRNLAVEMTLGEAVERKILPTPTYVPVWYDIDGKMNRYEQDVAQVDDPQKQRELENKLEQLKRCLENSYGAEDIFRKYMSHDHGKFIVFCRDREHLEEMKNTVPQWLAPVNQNVRCYVSISAQEDKDLQLRAFKDDKKEDAVRLLFTIDRLNEGLHVKGIDGVMMLRPTISPIVYLQQMGRALSVGHGNPLIFDMVNNYQSVQIPMKDGSYVNVFEKDFRDAMEQSGNVTMFRIFEDMMDFTSFFSELEFKLYHSFDAQWNTTFLLLEKFLREYSRFPQMGEVYEGVKLGKWCSRQKYAAKTSRLPPERFDKLKSIGLWDISFDNIWEENFTLLKKFKEEYSRFPKGSEVYEGVSLGHWCERQKSRGKKFKLSSERFEKLKSIGLLDNTLDNIWEENFFLLQKFIEEYSRFPKTSEVYEGANLGNWCSTQRTKAKSPNFSSERFEKLKSIGFFDDTWDNRWEKNFSLLEKFIDEFNRLPKQGEVYEEFNLGNWCSTQRINAKSPNFSSEQFEKLKSVGLFDDTWDNRWEKNFSLLEKFIDEFNRLPKQSEVFEGFKLGIWCNRQKQAAKASRLTPEKFEKLKSIGLLDDTLDNRWEENFTLLKKFIEEYSRFPLSDEMYEDVNLGIWCQSQKCRAKASKLPPDRYEKLKAIGLLDDTRDDKWGEKFALLEKFIDEFNRLPKQSEDYEGFKLGKWCSRQKQTAKASRLSLDRIEKLKAIGLLQCDEETSRKLSLSCQIQSASTRVAASYTTDKSTVRESTAER